VPPLPIPDHFMIILVVRHEKAVRGHRLVAVTIKASIGVLSGPPHAMCRDRRANAHDASRMTLSLLTTRLVVAFPALGPADAEKLHRKDVAGRRWQSLLRWPQPK